MVLVVAIAIAEMYDNPPSEKLMGGSFSARNDHYWPARKYRKRLHFPDRSVPETHP